MKNFKLIEARKQAGYTQETLAKEVNISQAAISKYENGIDNPSLDIAYKISVVLSVPMDVFIMEKVAS